MRMSVLERLEGLRDHVRENLDTIRKQEESAALSGKDVDYQDRRDRQLKVLDELQREIDRYRGHLNV